MAMTRKQAHQTLRSVFPEHSINVKCQSWIHYHNGKHLEEDIAFTVSVLPGIGGKACSQTDGETLADAVAKMLVLEPEDEAEPDENEQYFSSVPSYSKPEEVETPF